ncbi:MAG: hypothetical protein AAF587_34330 [Bacteroidota bacterium]
MSQLDKILKDYLQNLKILTQNIGEPIHLKRQEVEQFLSDKLAEQEVLLSKGKSFLLALDIKNAAFLPFDRTGLTAPGLKKVLGHEEDISYDYFMRNIIPEAVLVEFLKTGISAYEEVIKNRTDEIKVHEHAYTSYFPVQAVDGTRYFVAQKCVPIQVDAQGQLISHLNTYHILYTIREDRKLYVEIGGVDLNESPEVEITNAIVDLYEQYIFTQIMEGISAINRIGPRLWRCLYEYVYVYNTTGDMNSNTIFFNLIQHPDERLLNSDTYQEDMDVAIVRKDIAKVRKWLNAHFCISDQYKLTDAASTVNFLRRNRYFKQIKTPFGEKNV